MICDHKGSVNSKSWVEEGEIVTICDRCGLSGSANLADVYWPGHAYKSESLDVEFTSRGQKAAYLKEHGLSEAGDIKFSGKNWIEGSKEYRRKQFEKDRPRIREIARAWRERRHA
jgi:hypothetical protein